MLDGRWRWLLRLIVHAGAVYAASQVVPGVRVQGWGSTLVTVLLLGSAICFVEPGVDSIRRLRRNLRWPVALVAGTVFWLTASALARASGLAFQVDTAMAAFVAAVGTKVTSFLLVRLGGI